jgi:hypothetical protein
VSKQSLRWHACDVSPRRSVSAPDALACRSHRFSRIRQFDTSTSSSASMPVGRRCSEPHRGLQFDHMRAAPLAGRQSAARCEHSEMPRVVRELIPSGTHVTCEATSGAHALATSSQPVLTNGWQLLACSSPLQEGRQALAGCTL